MKSRMKYITRKLHIQMTTWQSPTHHSFEQTVAAQWNPGADGDVSCQWHSEFRSSRAVTFTNKICSCFALWTLLITLNRSWSEFGRCWMIRPMFLVSVWSFDGHSLCEKGLANFTRPKVTFACKHCLPKDATVVCETGYVLLAFECAWIQPLSCSSSWRKESHTRCRGQTSNCKSVTCVRERSQDWVTIWSWKNIDTVVFHSLIEERR